MRLLLKSRISDELDSTLENVKQYEQSVAERKIQVYYENGIIESYSMMQYMAEEIGRGSES